MLRGVGKSDLCGRVVKSGGPWQQIGSSENSVEMQKAMGIFW